MFALSDHNTLHVWKFPAKRSSATSFQPFYLPPVDFFSFSKIKTGPKGAHFGTIERHSRRSFSARCAWKIRQLTPENRVLRRISNDISSTPFFYKLIILFYIFLNIVLIEKKMINHTRDVRSSPAIAEYVQNPLIGLSVRTRCQDTVSALEIKLAVNVVAILMVFFVIVRLFAKASSMSFKKNHVLMTRKWYFFFHYFIS